jgi:hypothetical protein
MGTMVRARTCRGHGKSVSFAISKHFTKDLKVACESPMGFAIPSMAAQFLSSRFDAIRSRRHAGARERLELGFTHQRIEQDGGCGERG